ncbi:MAG: hypothetical protein ACK58U_09435 [Rubrivivax sp.]
MNPADLTSRAKGRRPSDVFNGAAVKRKFVEEVLDIIRKTATSHQTFIEGTMVSSSERSEWTLHAGKAVKTAPFWGRPSSLYVEGEEARARLMQAMGIDLGSSHTYRKYL